MTPWSRTRGSLKQTIRIARAATSYAKLAQRLMQSEANARIVPIVPQAEAALAKIPRRLKEPRIFWSVHSRYQLYDHLQKRLAAAGMKDQFTFHSLRHTFGAWCSQSGVDLCVISAAMGHSSVRTTERLYAHLSPDYRRLELRKLGTAFSVGTTRAQEERKLSET